MSDRMRWRYGDTNPVVAAVDLAAVIEQGDLVYQDVDQARPAGLLPEVHEDTTLQRVFAKHFLGVAMQRSRSGDTDPIRVATTGVFEFDCPSGSFELGDLMGVDYELRGGHPDVGNGQESSRLLNQQVALVNDAKLAIARVAKRVAMAATSVLVDIRSTVMGGIDNQ